MDTPAAGETPPLSWSGCGVCWRRSHRRRVCPHRSAGAQRPPSGAAPPLAVDGCAPPASLPCSRGIRPTWLEEALDVEAWRLRPSRRPRAQRRLPARRRVYTAAALHRGAAVRQHERRSGAGIFLGRLTEEILNSLAHINELQVAARTSAFSFKGKDLDIGTVARKLNVAAVLEGSVRRSGPHRTRHCAAHQRGHRVSRVVPDLRPKFGDVLKLQTEIATAVASALKVTLLGDVAAKIEVGGTRNPAAFDAYLRASKAYFAQDNEHDSQVAIAGYTEAIRLDPDYALAYAGRSIALESHAENYAAGPAVREYLTKALADAQNAIALAPSLGEAHMALAYLFERSLDFTRASQEYTRALALAPGNARLLKDYGLFAVKMGQTERPRLGAPRGEFGSVKQRHPWFARSVSSDSAALRRGSNGPQGCHGTRSERRGRRPMDWICLLPSGDLQSARAACETVKKYEPYDCPCLAVTYDRLGRHAEAKTMLGKLQASSWGTAHPVLSAAIYAQWGDTARALDWLEAAMRQHDTYLEYLKAFAFFDPLRNEPRFQAIERQLKFPS